MAKCHVRFIYNRDVYDALGTGDGGWVPPEAEGAKRGGGLQRQAGQEIKKKTARAWPPELASAMAVKRPYKTCRFLIAS